jgi:hypothetical protein
MRRETVAEASWIRGLNKAFDRGAAAALDPAVEALGNPYKRYEHALTWREGLAHGKKRQEQAS